MAESACSPMLVVASEVELPAAQPVWGTGGWRPPEDREALDWLTLSRLLGWGVTVSRVTRSGSAASLSGGSCWVVLACEPDCLKGELTAYLASRLAAEPILVVARAGTAGSDFARLAGAGRRPERVEGRSVRWSGPGPERKWYGRTALDAGALEPSGETSTWATLEGAPLIVARRVGRGVVATLGFHPSRARDVDGAATALLKHLLIWGSPAPVAWLDLEGSLVLRMDDPGGAQNVHSRGWSYPKLGEAEWAAIGAELMQRSARMSIGYVIGWVDDGDVTRGILKVAGHMPRRVPGRVYPSPLVKYWDRAGHAPGTVHDYEAEFRGIQALRAAGLVDVELHGYTHMHPDSAPWATAPDRYESKTWYRELGSAAGPVLAARPANRHPLALGIAGFGRYFAARPTTLICPGDEWTDDVLARALDLELQLVSSYYLALLDGDRFWWTTHVCAPYLDEPNASWFDAGLPVVGYFHDREPALEGVGWIGRWLDRWHDAGAKRLLDLRELAASVGRRLHLEERNGELRLTVTTTGAPALVRPLTVGIRLPERRIPARLSVLFEDGELSLNIHALGDSVGRIILPPSSEGADAMIEGAPQGAQPGAAR